MVRGTSEGLNATHKKNKILTGEEEREHSKVGKEVKKSKYQLLEYNSLPAFLRDNEFILDYYRSEWPLKQIILSIFSIHNETLNVWT